MKPTTGQQLGGFQAAELRELQSQDDRQQKDAGLRISLSRARQIRPPLPSGPSFPALSLTPATGPASMRGIFYISSLHPVSSLPLSITHTRFRKRGCMGRYNGGPTNVLPVIVSMYSGGAACLCMCVCAPRGLERKLGSLAFM